MLISRQTLWWFDCIIKPKKWDLIIVTSMTPFMHRNNLFHTPEGGGGAIDGERNKDLIRGRSLSMQLLQWLYNGGKLKHYVAMWIGWKSWWTPTIFVTRHFDCEIVLFIVVMQILHLGWTVLWSTVIVENSPIGPCPYQQPYAFPFDSLSNGKAGIRMRTKSADITWLSVQSSWINFFKSWDCSDWVHMFIEKTKMGRLSI